nr:tetratricopeptide repeat protein [uncultured Methanoregula sp.]
MKSKTYLIAGSLIAILVIALALLVVLPSLTTDPAAKFQQAGALYTKSVDLANEGKYTEALKAADDALALNTPQLMPIIQSNRAGILVMLGKNDEALTAADAALSSHENLTTTFSIAYFNKGNALKNLGRTDEAKAAYAKAHELDPTLVSPI